MTRNDPLPSPGASDTGDHPGNFVHEIIEEDLRVGKNGGRVVTRFPPEPNGYLHIGHAKSICLNFGIARSSAANATCATTTPTPRTRTEFVESIERDVRWLGFDWDDRKYLASDYFEQLYDFAVELIREGKAYVDNQTAEEIRATPRRRSRSPARTSPYREPHGRREPRPLRPDAQGRVPRRRAGPARQDRHGVAELQPARSGHVPHPPRAPPPHRRQVVHLPDVRLGPRPSDSHRGDHALDLHAGVREPPPALRLVHRRSFGSQSHPRSRSSSRGSTSPTRC